MSFNSSLDHESISFPYERKFLDLSMKLSSSNQTFFPFGQKKTFGRYFSLFPPLREKWKEYFSQLPPLREKWKGFSSQLPPLREKWKGFSSQFLPLKKSLQEYLSEKRKNILNRKMIIVPRSFFNMSVRVYKGARMTKKLYSSLPDGTISLSAAVIAALYARRRWRNRVWFRRPFDVTISKEEYPEIVAHIKYAVEKKGMPTVLTLDREGADKRRREALKDYESNSETDLDEYPFAMTKRNKVSIRRVSIRQNRGAGASIGSQCKHLRNGRRIRVNIVACLALLCLQYTLWPSSAKPKRDWY